MPSRPLSLEEWFLLYQLERIRRDHFHVPVRVEADVTHLDRAYRDQGKDLPVTALLIKAKALLAQDLPFVNRVLFRTWLGDRILEPKTLGVNLPLIRRIRGRKIVSGMTLSSPQGLTLEAIQKKMHAERSRPLEDLSIGKILYDQPNTFLRRLRLKVLHQALHQLPSLYEKLGAGGLSVSSLIHPGSDRIPVHLMAFGPTLFTVSCSSLTRDEKKTTLHLGVGFDHLGLDGYRGMQAAKRLFEILKADSSESMQRILAGDDLPSNASPLAEPEIPP